jgi:RNA polymerase sigma factor (TIGR02999 family)
MSGITDVLSRIDSGDAFASAELLPLVYDELRALASARLAQEQPGQTLQATALVHEAYLRLVGPGEAPGWRNRAHFFAAAAEAMRRILVDAARRKGCRTRAGQRRRLDLESHEPSVEEAPDEVLAVNDALAELAKLQPAKAELVKLRYFGGLTLPEAAQVLDVSLATAERYWKYARAWLAQKLRDME